MVKTTYQERIKLLYASVSEERERKALLQGESQRPSSRISYYRDIGALINLGPDGNCHPSYFKAPTWY